jgi:protein-disulfide isomerase
MKPIVRIAVLAAAVLLAGATDKPASNWLKTVAVTENGGHVLGNPDAEVKLTEYVSYTCPHCASFHRKADVGIKIVYVQPGKISLEIQHFIRDPVDLAVAMLTNCGEPSGFYRKHSEFLASQDKWLAKAGSINQAQQQRWYNGTLGARMQAVAHDFDFYKIMERRGLSISEVNRCLADQAMADKLASQRAQAIELGVNATPSFAIDGVLLTATHDWDALAPQLKARF